VEIRVQDEWGRDAHLEQALCERFGLAHVRVAAFRPHADAVAAAAILAAEWLDDRLRDGQILGLSWGRSLQAVVSAVSVDEPRQLEVVPLMGGLPTASSAVAGQELVRELAGRLGATYRRLEGPALLRSEKARDALLAEPSIAAVLAQARSADIALVGVGSVGLGSSVQVLEGLALSPAEREAFRAQNPVGDTCCRFFDAEGQPVRGPADDRVLAVELDDLRRIPTVVGVATGCDKTAGVLGALRGGILDGLITDAVLAHSVLTAEGLL
jgi:DNA-binding transcriptional regulator LsrR (DeoR family)